MIKIAQISDIHWRGSTRHEEYTRSFEKLFELLREDKPDLIVCTGDIFHTKTQGITPEVVERMVWMFQELLKIAPVRTILGNHDGNLANAIRQDAISPIVKAFNQAPQFILYKESGNFEDPLYPNINWCVFSCFDHDGWSRVTQVDNKTNIAMYHGALVGCQSDGGYKMTSGEENVAFFNDYDFVLMGDIHKQQYMSERLDKDGKDKPWIGYPGSLIQQNFGEQPIKGYLIWEIEDRMSWDVYFRELPNFQPYLTFDWQGDVNATLGHITQELKGNFLPGSRFRLLSKQAISDVEKRQVSEFLKEEKGAEEVNLVFNIETNLESFEAGTIKTEKTSLRNNPDVICQLYGEYLINNQAAHPLTEQQQQLASNKINEYFAKLNASQADMVARDVKWSLKSLDFDNIFRYGEGNSIDFTKLNGIVGIFGQNRVGKSSIVGTLMYSLFNATDRGPVKTAHIINKNKSSCRVRAHLDINGTDYVIERSSQRDEPKKKKKKQVDDEKTSTSLTVTKVLKDGSFVPITGISRDESDKELRRLIGTSEDFLLTSFASQDDMNRFIREGATERKAILSRFLELDIFKNLADMSKEDCSILNAKTKRYSEVQWEQLIEDAKKEIQNLEATKVVLESRIVEKRQQAEDIRTWILSKEKQFDVASITEFEKQLQAKNKQIDLMQKNEVELKETLRLRQSELLQIELQLQNIKIEDLESKHEQLIQLKDILSQLESSFRVETTTLEHQEKSVKKLDVVPCGDSFPQCHFIKDSHENKSKLDSQKSLVKDLREKYDTAKASLDLFLTEKVSEKIKEHRSLTERKNRLDSVLVELRTKLKGIDIVKLVSDREELKEKIAKLRLAIGESEESEIQSNRDDLSQLKIEISTLESQKSDIFQQLGSQNQKLDQFLREKLECADILNELQIYESIYKAFSKNGIPAMILKGQMPAINEELSKILSNMVDFKIVLETDTTANVMDVFIEDSTSRRVIETASGMEKMVASLALRVALTNLSSLPKSDIFILDEGFGPLDDTSVHQCLQLVSFLKNYFKTILVITHIAPMKEIADKLIDIKYDDDFSYVNV